MLPGPGQKIWDASHRGDRLTAPRTSRSLAASQHERSAHNTAAPRILPLGPQSCYREQKPPRRMFEANVAPAEVVSLL